MMGGAFEDFGGSEGGVAEDVRIEGLMEGIREEEDKPDEGKEEMSL